MEGPAMGVELWDIGTLVVGRSGIRDYGSTEECVREAEAGYN